MWISVSSTWIAARAPPYGSRTGSVSIRRPPIQSSPSGGLHGRTKKPPTIR
jgi:hypothetical protein